MENAKLVAKRPDGSVRAPVRVKLERVNACQAKACPPDSSADVGAWRDRLKQALGTTSDAFVDASLYQLQAAAQLPGSGISEIAVNAALAMIEAAAPKDEIEGALAVQMACTHTAAMAVISRLEMDIRARDEWRRSGRPPLGCSGPIPVRSSCFGGCVTADANMSVSSTST